MTSHVAGNDGSYGTRKPSKKQKPYPILGFKRRLDDEYLVFKELGRPVSV